MATHAWEPLSFARLSDWARERAGLLARSVYDLANVDAALARLPHVEAAFMGGEISWSKTRLPCRVAEPADESRWVTFARRSPVQTLEREVRAVDRGYRTLGYRSVETYARERLGISRRKARALLRLERAGTLCPELREAYRDGRLSWVQALMLVPIIVLDPALPWRRRWIEHATQITVRRLEDDVERALAYESLEPPDERQVCAKPMRAGGIASASPSAAETSRFFFNGLRDVALLIEATICTVRRHIERQIGRLPTRRAGTYQS